MVQTIDWAARFAALGEELRAHRHLDVQDFEVRPPISASSLALAEESYDVEASDEVKSFYRQLDGVDIRWIAAPEAHPGVELDTFLPDISGRIYIPRFEEIIHDRWGDFLWHQDVTDDEVEEAHCCDDLRPFNFFDRYLGANEAICLAMTVVKPPDAQGYGLSRLHCDDGVLHGGQRWITGRFTWNDKPVGLSAYLELLLSYRGIRTWHRGEPWSHRAVAAIFGGDPAP